MPSTSVFDQQDVAYKESVLPSDVFARVAVEAAHKDFWYKYVGLDGAIIGMESFGESAPGSQLMEHFGFTVDAVVEAVNELLDN
jgi:transketolase